MDAPITLELAADRHIAYHRLSAHGDGANLPGIVFLGGFRSDMTGTKALFLEDWARKRGRAYLRFDYRGHGASSARFEDGCIGDWVDGAAEVLQQLTEGPQILIGSSMGGWIALLLARRFPERVAGLIGIAAAPDFTADSMLPALSTTQRAEMEQTGQIALPSEYSDEPYVITRRLLEDGQSHLVLRAPLAIGCPVRLIHGMADPDVPVSVALRLIEHLDCDDARLTLIKDGGHRLSEPDQLAMIGQMVDEVTVAG